ncbi:EH domain-binding protein 1 [Cydia pomonella]|uniref:EH domain-binding protein 1 n=1 Tax=Cydia pomonella TaxID=82600 RepID=UPI002ADD5E6B|nr:EH domain-binding protein 1 [Cydia pomonella]
MNSIKIKERWLKLKNNAVHHLNNEKRKLSQSTARMASVWKRLQRVNKRAAKFEYTASYHRVDLDTSPKWKPNKLSIVWTRRSRRVITDPVQWEPSLKDPLKGSVMFAVPENRSVAVTLFKDARTNELEDKDWTFVLEDVSPTGKRRRLAVCAINMRKYASLEPSQRALVLTLEPTTQKIQSASLHLTLHCVLLREGQATDEDMQSLASLLSVNNNSDIAVLEDLDEDDYTLSDNSTRQMSDLRQQMEEMTQSLTNSDVAATPDSVQSLRLDERTPTAPASPAASATSLADQTPTNDLKIVETLKKPDFLTKSFKIEPKMTSTPKPTTPQESFKSVVFKPKMVSRLNLKPLDLKSNFNSIGLDRNDNEKDDEKTPTGEEKIGRIDKDKTPVQDLLEWCQTVTGEYKQCRVTNLTTSFRSGLAFCAIIHRFRPDLIDFSGLQPDESEQNLRVALEASATLGISQVLTAADVCKSKPDRLAIMTYLFQLRAHFTGNELQVEQLGNDETESSYLVGRHDTDGSLPRDLFSREISTRRSKNMENRPRPGSQVSQDSQVSVPSRHSQERYTPDKPAPVQPVQSPAQRPRLMTRKELTDPFGSDDEDCPPAPADTSTGLPGGLLTVRLTNSHTNMTRKELTDPFGSDDEDSPSAPADTFTRLTDGLLTVRLTNSHTNMTRKELTDPFGSDDEDSPSAPADTFTRLTDGLLTVRLTNSHTNMTRKELTDPFGSDDEDSPSAPADTFTRLTDGLLTVRLTNSHTNMTRKELTDPFGSDDEDSPSAPADTFTRLTDGLLTVRLTNSHTNMTRKELTDPFGSDDEDSPSAPADTFTRLTDGLLTVRLTNSHTNMTRKELTDPFGSDDEDSPSAPADTFTRLTDGLLTVRLTNSHTNMTRKELTDPFGSDDEDSPSAPADTFTRLTDGLLTVRLTNSHTNMTRKELTDPFGSDDEDSPSAPADTFTRLTDGLLTVRLTNSHTNMTRKELTDPFGSDDEDSPSAPADTFTRLTDGRARSSRTRSAPTTRTLRPPPPTPSPGLLTVRLTNSHTNMTRKELTDPFGSDDEDSPSAPADTFTRLTDETPEKPKIEPATTDPLQITEQPETEKPLVKETTPDLPKPTPQLLSRHDELKERARQLLEATKREARAKEKKRQESKEKDEKEQVNGIRNGDLSPTKPMTEEERQQMLRERARKLIANARAGIVSPTSPTGSVRSPRGTVEIISKQSVMDEIAAVGGVEQLEAMLSQSSHSSPGSRKSASPDRSEGSVGSRGRSPLPLAALLDNANAEEGRETGSYIQSELEALEREQSAIDERAAALEKQLRCVMQSADNTEEEDRLMSQWFNLVNKKNALLRRQMQLNILEQEEDLSRRCELLARELRLSLGVEEWRKTDGQKRRERLLLQELLSAVNERDRLVQEMDEQEKAIANDDEIERNLSQVEIQRKNNCILQ